MRYATLAGGVLLGVCFSVCLFFSLVYLEVKDRP